MIDWKLIETLRGNTMEKEFYIHIDQFGEEHIIEERTVEDIVKEFTTLYNGNPIRTIWSLVDFMKSNYEQGNDEMAEMYYNAVVSVIKEKLASE